MLLALRLVLLLGALPATRAAKSDPTSSVRTLLLFIGHQVRVPQEPQSK